MSLVFNQKITLDLTISRVQNVHCSQDDADSRNILITLSDNGKPYSIPSEVRILLKISKPDNTYVYIDEDDVDHLFRNDDGTISIILSEQATCVPGICEAELQFITPKETISTRKFNIIVKKSVINDEEIESVIESNIIQKMIRHLIDFMNPHKVNKEQVGLGNVPNVTTNDQTPTYEEAEEFENISSGEKLSIAFGKIQKAISSLLGHINNFDNPHKTTKSQIQLGNVDNTSDVDKPVSTAQQKAIDGAYANSNKYTDKKIADLINGAPETMDTLKEVADAIEKNKSVVEALNKAIGTKANQSELDTHTGNNTIHITPNERTDWNDANNKKHTHSNKSVLDGITSELVQKWTETSSSSVTGIKGANEDTFRRGNVVLTAKDVGAVPTGGDTAENTVKFNTASERKNLASGESHTTLFGKIAKWFADLKEVAFTGKIPWVDVTGKPSTYTPASHTHDNQYYKKEESDATLAALMQSLIKRDEDVKVELIDGYTTADSGLNNRITAVVNELKKYLPLSGGTLTGSLDIASGKYIHGTHTNGTILDILGLNKNNNCHVGNNATPTFLHGAGYQLDISGAFICPNVSNQMSCGTKNKLWTTVFSKTGAINTSDRTKKHNIIDLTEAYEQLFLKLKPKSFIFNDGDRVHIGAISQDVEDAMQELGIEPRQFAGFCKDIRYEYTEYNEEDGTPVESSKVPCKDEDGNIIYDYALRYQEFIFLTVHMVQKLWNRVEILEKQNAEMRDQIKSMQQDIAELKKIRA
nr:MAG TPA: structural protein [Caudoviricetes sp.]